MNKTLLKRSLYELLENIARLDLQIQDLETTAQPSTLAYLAMLRNDLAGITSRLLQRRDELLKLYQGNPIEEELSETFFDRLFPQTREEVNRLGRALYRLKKTTVLPETELFLNSLSLGKLLPDAPGIIVLPARDEDDRDTRFPSESLLLEYLPILSTQTPLRWLGLLDAFSSVFCRRTIQLDSLLEQINLPEPQKEALLVPLLNLRLLGPGYYPHYVLKAVETMDAQALWAVEPILFQELNRFGLVNKDLVILHQSIDRLRQQRSHLEPKDVTRVISGEDLTENILKDVEKVIPERLAFTEKFFIRSQILEDRLSHDTLISAVPMLSSPSQLREELGQLEEEGSIYPFLTQLQESPSSPREIINAGWLHKLDQSFGWMQDALLADNPVEGWEILKRRIWNLDTNLLKSIEISEVHRVLSHQESEALVPA